MKKCIYKGKQVILADKEFLASGGQGDIYLHAGLVYKIYHDALQSDLVDKILELTVLDRPNIIRPLDVVYSSTTNLPIGYTMNYADNTAGLPLLFTTSFLTRNNIQLSDTQVLIKEMADTISFIHDKQILLVDGNEFNYLVDKNGYKRPYFIDVDSYKTPKHDATVIMPSVRDYLTKGFTTLTDWYSFSVITFQLFTGIHPYKGKHPTLKTMEERCKHHISVFNKDVGTPPSVRDFNSIPTNYLTWYQDMFERGLRTPPPDMVSAVQIRTKRKYVSAAFNISKIFTADQPIKSVEWLFGNLIVMTEDYIYVNGKQFDRHHKYSVVVASDAGILYEIYFNNEQGMIINDILRKYTLPEEGSTFRAKKWFSVEGRFYSIYESQLFEFDIRQVGTNSVPIVIHTQPIHEQSSQTFSGVVYANILGRAYFYIPNKTKSVDIYQQPALDGKRIIDAKYERDQLVVIAAEADGTIIRLRMAPGCPGSQLIESENISMQETNTTVLPNKVSITYDSVEDQVDISYVNAFNHKIIQNAGLPASATLVSTGTQAHYFVDNTLYSFSVK